MPSCESENVRKTLMEYMMTRKLMLPPVSIMSSIAAMPMTSTPFRMVSRSESAANFLGNHESMAMFAMTRGPPMNPVCEATTSKAPSEKIMMKAIQLKPPSDHGLKRVSARTALSVLFGSGSTLMKK